MTKKLEKSTPITYIPNSLQNDKNLHLSKWNDISNVSEIMVFGSDRVKNILGKGENVAYLFLPCFY